MKSIKPIKFILIFLILTSLVFSMGDSPRSKNSIAEKDEIYPHLELLAKVMATIQQRYVSEVEAKELIDNSLKGMVNSLDPYSQFMTPEIKSEFEVETKGELEGVGMVITLQDSVITVISPIEDTPAFRAGIESGDKILEIDGEPTKGWPTWEAAKKLRGEPGTKVTIKVWREGEEDLLTIELERALIHIESVKNVKVIKDNIGYIRVTAFREETAQKLEDALEELLEQGATSLILDLRSNPGGFLDSAIQTSDLFKPKGELIVYTEGRKKADERKYHAQTNPIFPTDYDIVILVNEGSASASEIVAGALKDSDRTKLIGTRTFGKGAVQSLIDLDDEYALRLTTAHYYIPEGRCIEGEGIAPDIEIELSKEQKKEIREFLAGYQDEETPDSQLKKAIEYLTKGSREKQVDLPAKDWQAGSREKKNL
jgi:carboxyl-terminal processing protease